MCSESCSEPCPAFFVRSAVRSTVRSTPLVPFHFVAVSVEHVCISLARSPFLLLLHLDYCCFDIGPSAPALECLLFPCFPFTLVPRFSPLAVCYELLQLSFGGPVFGAHPCCHSISLPSRCISLIRLSFLCCFFVCIIAVLKLAHQLPIRNAYCFHAFRSPLAASSTVSFASY